MINSYVWLTDSANFLKKDTKFVTLNRFVEKSSIKVAISYKICYTHFKSESAQRISAIRNTVILH